ncbi:WD40-repeat-containing domain protein [Mycena pura]|uniref:WD40-repeat-containing domain protein n=1 Tax=Mycena pura TaxID=153505 RepID=A0AAD6YKP6_9AGAR|nr:WD40-repeat-containing domain protein [Mycena pura]
MDVSDPTNETSHFYNRISAAAVVPQSLKDRTWRDVDETSTEPMAVDKAGLEKTTASLLSRISLDSLKANILERNPTSPSSSSSNKDIALSSRVNSANSVTSTSAKKGLVQLPTLTHPLPVKPPPSASVSRGAKRERPPSDLWTAPGIVRIRKRNWPTAERTRSDLLKGDGDLGILSIAFNVDSSCFALICRDRTLRIWNNKAQAEVAQLPHNSAVVGMAWLDEEEDVMSLTEDGELGKWVRMGRKADWQWSRIMNVGSEQHAPEDKVCLACARGRIAVAFPRSGVKVWIWQKGTWRAQRSISRTNVTALKFIDGGDALLGGTREGVVWRCAVPNGTMKVYAFLQSSITSIAINPTGTQALIAQAGGSACLVNLGSQDEKRVRQSYLDDDLRDGSLGALFAAQGKTLVFGTMDGCLLLWDAQKGSIFYGMEYEVACCDGPQSCVVAGTRDGRLLWWPHPKSQPSTSSHTSRKRAKLK